MILTLDGLLFQARQQSQSLSRYTQQEDRLSSVFSDSLFGEQRRFSRHWYTFCICLRRASLSLL